jgi:glycerophosphoryl diester phosphodiesterase
MSLSASGVVVHSFVSMSTSAPASFIVAHRAGNDLERLRAAEALRLRLVEADVHLFAGRLEVRHRKTVGPVPILWDRWELAPPWAPRMVLDELLAAAGPGTELMLDLKGHDPGLPERVLAAIGTSGRDGRITVCSQDWRLLEPFAAQPEIRVVHSVGNARQLTRLWRRDGALAGVSIHERLLDAAVVEELRRRAALVLSWPVESVAQARRLAGWGVHGLISRSFESLAAELG